MIFYTGATRSASSVLEEQTKNNLNSQNVLILKRMAKLAHEFKYAIESEDMNAIGEQLRENWELKKSLAKGISNSLIDSIYEAGKWRSFWW